MIGESELIITGKGTIYHLDLQPGETGDIILTVGDPGRVKQVSKYFTKTELKREHREFITHTGIYNNKRISVISTGIGTDNIDIVLTELDALVNIDFKQRKVKDKHTALQVIRIGTSGSLQQDIEVDSFVASESAIGLDNLMMYYNIPNDEQPLLDAFKQDVFNDGMNTYHFNADEALLQKFGDGMKKGITVTCSGFYGPQGRILRGPLRFNNLIEKLTAFQYSAGGKLHQPVNFEMETSGIYGMSRMLGHKAVSLSAIVANRLTKKFSSNVPQATDNLIQHVFSQL